MVKRVLTAALVALAGSAATATGAAAAGTCKNLTDATASIYTAITYIADKNSDLANLPLNKLMAPIDKELPWLSTCLASADVLTVGLGLLTNADASKCINELTSGFSSNSTTNATDVSEDTFATSLCPSMKSTIFPCVDTVLVNALNQLMTSGGACCTDMQTQLKVLLGQDLKAFLSALMVRVGDVLCSVKTYTDPATGVAKNETCGTNLVDIVTSGQGLGDLIQMIQVPNDQACAAMKGQNFTATDGKSYKFFDDKESLDSCFAPLNALFTDLAKLPMIAQSNVSSAFAAKQCLKGATMLEWSLDEKALVQGVATAFDGIVTDMKLAPAGSVTKVVRAGFEDMKKDFAPMCFHIPNSVSDCVYDTSVVYAFSTDTPPPVSDKKTPSGTQSAASHTFPTFAAGSLATATTLAMLLM